jgi:hypothetical protein
MNIARVLGCPVARVVKYDFATKTKICFVPHEKMIKFYKAMEDSVKKHDFRYIAKMMVFISN